MNSSIIIGLLQNASILLAFAILYGFFKIKNVNKKHFFYEVGVGLIIGVFGIFLISTPWITVPGISFDTRSVLLSVSGLFFGPVPTIIAMLVTGAYRIIIGGDGVYMGLAVIVTSGAVGLLWRHFRPTWEKGKYHLELIAMGIVVHVIMISCAFLLPSETVLTTLKSIAFPVIVIYPLITLLLGTVVRYQLKSWKIKQELDLSEERWKFATEGVGDGVWDWKVQTNEVYYSKLWKEILGYNESEIGNSFVEWDKRIHPNDKEQALKNLSNYLEGFTPEYKSEHRLLCKDGSYKWILSRGKVIERDNNGSPLRVIGTHSDISERKKADNELYESNEKLQAFLNNSIDAILLTSPDGKIHSANPAACQMLERTEKEICTLTRDELVDTSDPRLLKLIDERTKTGKANGEITMFRKDKKHFQAEISTALFKNGDGFTYSSLIVRDISERIKSQEIIRLNEERFRLISSVISDYMFESRVSEKGNLELVWTFGAFESITGYTPDEFIAIGGFRATIHPEDITIDEKDFEKLQRNQNVVTELRTFTKYGKIVWIRVYAQPIWDNIKQKLIGIYGAVQDITERRNIEKALTSSEEKFRKAFKTSPDSINLTRFSDGTFLEINTGFEKTIGYTQEEIIGRSSVTLNIWNNPDDRKKLLKGLEEKGFVENLEAEFVSKNGEIINGLMSASLIEVNNEKAILSITRDITERKIIETEIRKLNEELEEKVKLRTNELEIKISEIQRMNKLFVGRELRMKELKEKLKELENSVKGKTNN